MNDKKLIRRWDSERELSLRRHRTRDTKYNRLLHIFRHSSTRRLVLERMFTKFSEITQCNGHYAVQGHSRSPILAPVESSYTTSYSWLTLTYLLSCTVSKLRSNFPYIARGECLTLTLSLGMIPANIAVSDISLKTRFIGLLFCCRMCRCIFNHLYVIRPESYWIRWNYTEVTTITQFKVIQGHRF